MRNLLIILGLLILLPLASGAQPAEGKRITIENVAYHPPRIEIQAGQTVTWENKDDRDHTVVARDGGFNSGNIRPGETFRHTFSSPGTYHYGCSYHPRMKGQVVVKE